MIELLSRQTLPKLNPAFASFIAAMQLAKYDSRIDFKEHTEIIKSPYAGEIVYTSPADNFSDHIHFLSSAIKELQQNLDWQSVLMVNDFPSPWISVNPYNEMLKNANNFFRKNGIDNSFAGIINSNGDDLTELFFNLFQIIRYNASFPECFFSGIDRNFIGNICRYSNLHFYFYSDTDKKTVMNYSDKLGLIKIPDGRCTEQFSKDSTIENRSIII